jgi:hypothetical protein
MESPVYRTLHKQNFSSLWNTCVRMYYSIYDCKSVTQIHEHRKDGQGITIKRINVMDHLLIHISLFLLWSKLIIHDIQKQFRTFKQIRSINTELYYAKVIHQSYQIVAINKSVVIRIKPNSVRSIFDRWMKYELQWNMWKIQSKESSLCSFQVCPRTKKMQRVWNFHKMGW